MTKITSLMAAAIAAVSVAATPANAAVINQTHVFNLSALTGVGATAAGLTFNGFNTGLGTLTDAVISFSASMNISSTALVSPSGSGNQSVSSVSAIGTLSLSVTSAPGGFVLSPNPITQSLSTPSFTGTVLDNGLTQTLGSVSGGAINQTSVNYGTFAAGFFLPQFIGGTNLFTMQLASSSSQGGSVPNTVFTSNTGNSTGTVTVSYTYTELPPPPPPTGTPEPASMALLGAGLLGIGIVRRRRK